MDDFGSGYSSLNTLKDLLFDEVKLDRKFLGDTLTENARIVLQEVFHMLKRMGKSIVCEGVETQEIADFLQNEGCNEIQGFLYYRPMCQEDFEKINLKVIIRTVPEKAGPVLINLKSISKFPRFSTILCLLPAW